MLDQELLEEPQCMRRLGSRPVVSPECAVLSWWCQAATWWPELCLEAPSLHHRTCGQQWHLAGLSHIGWRRLFHSHRRLAPHCHIAWTLQNCNGHLCLACRTTAVLAHPFYLHPLPQRRVRNSLLRILQLSENKQQLFMVTACQEAAMLWIAFSRSIFASFVESTWSSANNRYCTIFRR